MRFCALILCQIWLIFHFLAVMQKKLFIVFFACLSVFFVYIVLFIFLIGGLCVFAGFGKAGVISEKMGVLLFGLGVY